MVVLWSTASRTLIFDGYQYQRTTQNVHFPLIELFLSDSSFLVLELSLRLKKAAFAKYIKETTHFFSRNFALFFETTQKSETNVYICMPCDGSKSRNQKVLLSSEAGISFISLRKCLILGVQITQSSWFHPPYCEVIEFVLWRFFGYRYLRWIKWKHQRKAVQESIQ